MYNYTTPDGYGDTFFIYNVNGEDIPIVNNNDYSLLGVPVADGMFVCRVWSGGVLIVDPTTGTVQVYDGVRNAWFQLPILQGNFPPSMAVLPEKVYRNDSSLRFDLTNVALHVNTNGSASVYADQMAWYGVKRNPGSVSDPIKSLYNYNEKPFSYPFAVQLTNFGPSDIIGNPIPGLSTPTQYTQLIQDYDFELRRISAVTTGGSQVPVTIEDEDIGSLSFLGVPGTTVQVVNQAGTPNLPPICTAVGTVVTLASSTNGAGNSGLFPSVSMIALIAATPSVAALITGVNPAGNFPTFGFPTSVVINPFSGLGGQSPYASPFKILLYDATWRQRMTVPILSELICHNNSDSVPPSSMPNNNWPSPPLLYPVNSVIRFDIFSLIPAGDTLPVQVSLLFEGVRRIQCQ